MTDPTPLYAFTGDWTGPVVATAVHTGHGLRDEVADAMTMSEQDRFREEDPFTDRLAGQVGSLVVPAHSRFEVDLNRAPADAVYRTPDQSWDMRVWRDDELAQDITARSLAKHEQFYAQLAERLDPIAAKGPFLLLDVHSYNHRRTPDHSPQPQVENPDVNVGTGSLDRDLWAPLVDAFIATMGEQQVDGEPIDCRENVKFKGANVAKWVHDRYPGVGCALAIEFKKTYMDEWTGEPFDARIEQHAAALGAAARRCEELLRAGEAQA